jgi:murein DD-endopeptidase MepM/ murein hydrolase activator NlpD
MAWITTSNYNNYIAPSTTKTTTKVVSNGDWVAPMKNMYCTWRTPGNNMSWSTYTSNSSGRNYHLGIDVYGTSGNVYSTFKGTVVACSSSTSGANGRYIIIRHTIDGKTVYSFYAHLSSVNVSKGQNVSAGQYIGKAGGSGYGKNNAYGTHLHFAIVDTLWSNGSYYGYATRFSGNKYKYQGVTYYNPCYVINQNRLP